MTTPPDWDYLLAPWYPDPPIHPEQAHTPWARGIWHAWNEHAVEVETAGFLSQLVKTMPASALIVETGTGQGFLTRAIESPNHTLVCYETDVYWANQLRRRAIFPRAASQLALDPTPAVGTMAKADLVLLDSMDPWRMAELCLWAACAKPGSILWVHDAGNGHPSWDGHYTLGTLIRTLKIPGRFLENPRGSFLAVQDSPTLPEWILALWAETLLKVGL